MEEEEDYSLYHIGLAERAGSYFMYAFNCLFFIAGACMFGVALYVQLSESLAESLGFLDFPEYYSANVVMILGSIVLMIASVAGFVGTSYRNSFLLLMYVIFSIISFFVNLGGSIYLLSQGLEGTRAYGNIKEKFYEYMYRYQYDMTAKYRVDAIQEYIQCCGAAYPSDWNAVHIPVPNTCRNQVTGNQYKNSCAEIMSRTLELYTGLSSGIALCICFLQLFTLVFVICLYRGSRARRSAAKMYDYDDQDQQRGQHQRSNEEL